jgi:predicted GH43/DUF377 family glycosyl hydrolase
MITVKKEGVILAARPLGFEENGVLNPAVIREGNSVHMFYRAVARGNYSTIGYCRLEGPLTVAEQYDKPVIFPQESYESAGVEDPRIVKVEDVYYLTYTAYDGVNALGALATSTDLKTFSKQGLLSPMLSYTEFRRFAETRAPLNEKYIRYNRRDSIKVKHHKSVFVWNKNIVFFPRRIGGRFLFLQRIKPDSAAKGIEQCEECILNQGHGVYDQRALLGRWPIFSGNSLSV